MISLRLAISGPMTGVPNDNREAFDEAYATLSKDANLLPVSEYFTDKKRRFQIIMDSDGVVVLPYWGKDEQAKAEVLLAVSLGKTIYAYHQHRPEKLERLSNVKIVTRAEILNG